MPYCYSHHWYCISQTANSDGTSSKVNRASPSDSKLPHQVESEKHPITIEYVASSENFKDIISPQDIFDEVNVQRMNAIP